MDVICINIVTVLDIFANNTNLQLGCNSVGSDNKTMMIYTNEVDYEISLGAFEKAVKIYYMFAGCQHKLVCIIRAYEDNDLLP